MKPNVSSMRSRRARREGGSRKAPSDMRGTTRALEIDLQPDLDDLLGWQAKVGRGRHGIARQKAEHLLEKMAHVAARRGDEALATEIVSDLLRVEGDAHAFGRVFEDE